MGNPFRKVALALAIFQLASCSTFRNKAAWTELDDWYKPRSKTTAAFTAKKLELQVWEISDPYELSAMKELETESFAEISMDDAIQISKIRIAPKPGMLYLIVRAVYLDKMTGRYECWEENRKLLVHHSSRGGKPLPMSREAVIIECREIPTEIFVECSRVE